MAQDSDNDITYSPAESPAPESSTAVEDSLQNESSSNTETQLAPNTEEYYVDFTAISPPVSEMEQTMAAATVAEGTFTSILEDASRLWEGITSAGNEPDSAQDETANEHSNNKDGAAATSNNTTTTTAAPTIMDDHSNNNNSNNNSYHDNYNDVPQTPASEYGMGHSTSTVNFLTTSSDLPDADYEFVVLNVAEEETPAIPSELEAPERAASEGGEEHHTKRETIAGDHEKDEVPFADAMETFKEREMEIVSPPMEPYADEHIGTQDILPPQHEEHVYRPLGDVDNLVTPVSDYEPVKGKHFTSEKSEEEYITTTTSTADKYQGTGHVVDTPEPTTTKPKKRDLKLLFAVLIGFGMALGSHIAVGTQPVFSSYLQNKAMIPPMSLNFVASGAMLLTIFLPAKVLMVLYGFVKRQIDKCSRNRKSRYSHVPHTIATPKTNVFVQARSIRPAHAAAYLKANKKLVIHFLSKISLTMFSLAILAIILLLRSVTVLIAARYAQPTYIALVRLLEPFITTILGVLVTYAQKIMSNAIARRKGQISAVGKKKTRKFSFPVFPVLITIWLALAFFGGGLIILGTTSRSDSEFTWGLDLSTLTKSFSESDAIGIGLVVLNVLLQSVYNILIMFLLKPSAPPAPPGATNTAASDLELQATSADGMRVNTTMKQAAPAQRPKSRTIRFSGFDMVLIQFIIYTSGYFVLGAATGEIAQWGKWLELSLMDYVISFFYATLVFFAVDILYAYASKLISSQNVSSIMATSLLSTMCFSWLINGEPINNLWMIVGAGAVVFSVTCFIITRRLAARSSQKKAMELAMQEHAEAVTAAATAAASLLMTSESGSAEHVSPYLAPTVDYSIRRSVSLDRVSLQETWTKSRFDKYAPDSDIARDISIDSLHERATTENLISTPSSEDVMFPQVRVLSPEEELIESNHHHYHQPSHTAQ